MARLAPDDFALTTPSGWSVSSLLAHLSFWDNRHRVLVERWKEHGFEDSTIDSVAVNDALKPIFLAMDPQLAVRLCLSAAEAVDAEIEAISSELVQLIEASATHFRINRSFHRNDHINEIEQTLRAAKAE